VRDASRRWDSYELMDALQSVGLAAGGCRNAEDRCDLDPQLEHLEWLTESPQTEIGTWRAKGFPLASRMLPFHRLTGWTARAELLQ
jgi:hypothetical protein